MQINNLQVECSLGQSSRRVRMSFLFSQDELLVCNKSSESCNNELLIGSERCITCADLGRFEFRSLLAPNQISKSSWACKTQGQPPSIYIIERHFEHQNSIEPVCTCSQRLAPNLGIPGVPWCVNQSGHLRHPFTSLCVPKILPTLGSLATPVSSSNQPR